MAEICQKVLDGFGMPVELALSIVVPICKGKGDIRNCMCHRAVKLLEHDMKLMERVLEKRIRRNSKECKKKFKQMQFGTYLNDEQLMLYSS